MSYFKVWSEKIEDSRDQEKFQDYVKTYYAAESEAYQKILASFPENQDYLQGKAILLAEKLGFKKDHMDIFLGFLDGVSESLTNTIELESVDDETEIKLEIDYEKLFWNMHDAKADWLYNLTEWDAILSPDQKKAIIKDYRTSKIVHREKIGRNDPCPCGSKKKYKQCCMNKEA